MIPVLQDILCAIQSLAAAIVNVFVLSINGLILLAGLILEGILLALPAMPAEPSPPDAGVLAWINWLIPLAPIFAFCGTALVLFAAFMAVKVLLNWLRAL